MSKVPAKAKPCGKVRFNFPRLCKNEDGATAIEFAMVAAPFLALLFGVMEIALVYFGTFNIENATEQAARMIRTGQAQGAGFSQQDFINQICNRVALLPSCASDLKVDVRSFDSFADMAAGGPSALDSSGDLDATSLQCCSMGGSGDVVLVNVYFKWGLIGKIPGIGLQNQSDGSRLLTAAVAFRNEPFSD